MDIKEALQNIGLNEKQAAVYIALLERGKASAYSIAVQSGLKKPTTYVILDELIKKGLARKIPRAGKQLYAPEPPEEMFALAEERLRLAQSALPQLKALTKGEEHKLSAIYFEGKEGIKQLLSHKLKEMAGKEFVGFYAKADQSTREELREFIDEYNAKMKRLKISVRGIVPEHPSLKEFRDTDLDQGRDMKIVPITAYSSDISIEVLEDTVRIADYKNLQGMVLGNPDIAKTFREIFEMVWKKY